jgi:hypothetical protein
LEIEKVACLDFSVRNYSAHHGAFVLPSKTGNYKFVTMSGRKISLEYKDLQL